ncbi:MAG: 50S ribosomal protein L25 [Actinomycetota bacterium]|jgi:large subunit ribosomal protein L25|nr:MAG: 50S ribosomal protein L25 [Actinomycetota bacterium]
MEAKLVAERREATGKGAARRLRARGRVPGILYGHGVEPIPISVGSLDLLHLFHASHGATMLVDLVVDGESHLAIPREVQRDHIHARFVHVDFLAVRRDERVRLSVEVHETGESPGVKAGGVIEHHLREVEVECLPTDVPEEILADLSSLQIGDMLRVGDLVPPKGVAILTDPEAPVISIITPAALRTEVDLTMPGAEAPAAEAPAPSAAEVAPAEEAPSEGGGGA